MIEHLHDKLINAVFVTFSGNCKQALTFYQTCFGGLLQFETFEKELPGCTELPVVSGSLVSERIIIHGSDLVHNEGRKIGNYISIYLQCENNYDRRELIKKLESGKKSLSLSNREEQQLIEVTDIFDVRWVFGV
ncbi:VOC family protein [Albibacterium bauzanense]|uniref:Putative glyoxalase superfamily protein PhnB n=1 Tax=Albibacterium bauzanense TaxID=653929 RepID=A0A4R1M6X2_9SPHI|nr:glyoxalase [Albibacterium bauzanense]TCK85539.1 putative glyoxalase superfamily protein PhnB [Albibacterium bauzanense]